MYQHNATSINTAVQVQAVHLIKNLACMSHRMKMLGFGTWNSTW